MNRESGRPCGCDPAAEHVCESHSLIDDSETEATIGWVQDVGALSSFVAVVTGPGEDGQFGIMAPGLQWLWFNRFEFEKLIDEGQRRLRLRK